MGDLKLKELAYSILWFTPIINKVILDQVKVYLKSGRKVFLLSYDDLDSYIESDEYLNQAAKKYLLNTYKVKYDQHIDNREILVFDGQNSSNDELLDAFNKNSSFNKEQYILEHQRSLQHALVKAGAGTGKTTTMINRISFLKHFYPALVLKEIVMITFTNDAAINMREKLMEKWKDYYDLTKNTQYLLWLEEINDMFIGTIHSFAKEFLTKEGTQFGFSPNLEIRSYRHRQRKLVEKHIDKFANEYKDIYQGFRYIPHYKIVQTVMNMMERINNKALSYKEIIEINYGIDIKNFNVFAKYIINNVQSDLLQLKQREGTLELHDLISRLGELRQVRNDKVTLPIKYLFVDEFQDTDESQVNFTVWLVEKYKSLLFAVGDIKQSIYRFRGADYTAFKQVSYQLDLINHQHKSYSIHKNYRSSKKLISQFNHLFAKWDDAVKQFQFETNDNLEAVKDDNESQGLITLNIGDIELKNLLVRFYGKDLVFLVRSNREVLDMVKRIEKLGYFCEADIKGSFYRSIAVREFYLLIRRLTHSNVSKDRYTFNLSSYSEKRVLLKDLLTHFDYEKPYVIELLDSVETDILSNSTNKSSVIKFLEQFVEKSDPADRYRKRFYQDHMLCNPDQKVEIIKNEAILQAKEYKANLERLLFILKKEFTSDVSASLYDIEKFLSIRMATDNHENEWKVINEDHKRFRVMTVHKAKGLEFDSVIIPQTDMAFLRSNKSNSILIKNYDRWNFGYKVYWGETGFENDLYRSNIHDENDESIAEETRLLYVALTRAKKTVIVNSSNNINRYKIQSWNDLLESGEMLGV